MAEVDLEDKEDRKKIWKRCVWTGVTREGLTAIVPDGDNSSPDVGLGTACRNSGAVFGAALRVILLSKI